MAGSADEVTYESLRNAWMKESDARSQFTLTRIDPSFYSTVDARIRDLQERYAEEHARDANSTKVMMLQDEIRNLVRVREDIFEARARKIAQYAIVAARGGNPDRSKMTTGELQLFEDLLRVLKDARRTLLKRGDRDLHEHGPAPAAAAADGDGASASEPAPEGHRGPPTPPDPLAEAPPPKAASTAAQALERPVEATVKEASLPGMEKPAPPPEEPDEPVRTVSVTATGEDDEEDAQAARPQDPNAPPRPRSGRVLVRVLGDVDAFTASDLRTYRLTRTDVAAVPAAEARLLAARGLAETLHQIA